MFNGLLSSSKNWARFEGYDGGDANAARGSSPSLLLSCRRGFGLDEALRHPREAMLVAYFCRGKKI